MSFANLTQNTSDSFDFLDGVFGEWIPSKEKIYIFGYGDFAKSVTNYFGSLGITFEAFVESEPKKQITETGEKIISLDEFKKLYKKGHVGLVMAINNDYLYTNFFPTIYFAIDDILFIDNDLLYKIKGHCLAHTTFRASWAITEHCNCSCYSCQIAAPIAKPSFYDLEEFKKEIDILHKYCRDETYYIGITSAEPLLHPEFTDFIVYARQKFPDVRIHVVTNGLLLHKQSDEFWSIMSDNNVKISWTKYPINYPFAPAEIFAKAARKNVNLSYVEDSFLEKKESWELLSNQKGDEKVYDYVLCPFHNSCVTVSRGRLFTCNRYAVHEHCSEKFGVNLPLTKNDYLD
jgi:hypothetical protein